MRLAYIGLIILLCSTSYSYAQSTRYTSALPLIQEEDGDPILRARKLKFANDSITDNGDGTASIENGVGSILLCDVAVDDYCFVYSDNLLKLYVNQILQVQYPIVAVFDKLLLESDDYLLFENGSFLLLE